MNVASKREPGDPDGLDVQSQIAAYFETASW